MKVSAAGQPVVSSLVDTVRKISPSHVLKAVWCVLYNYSCMYYTGTFVWCKYSFMVCALQVLLYGIHVPEWPEEASLRDIISRVVCCWYTKFFFIVSNVFNSCTVAEKYESETIAVALCLLSCISPALDF